jgi:hypothetical protein
VGGPPLADLRRVVGDLDSTLPLIEAMPLADHVRVGFLPQRIAATVAGLLGGVACCWRRSASSVSPPVPSAAAPGRWACARRWERATSTPPPADCLRRLDRRR